MGYESERNLNDPDFEVVDSIETSVGKVWYVTSPGGTKNINSDAVYIDPNCLLFAVLDGQGGFGGKSASNHALEEIETNSVRIQPNSLTIDQAQEYLSHLLIETSKLLNPPEQIYNRQKTTALLTILLEHTKQVVVASVGDSESYLFSNQELIRLSHGDTRNNITNSTQALGDFLIHPVAESYCVRSKDRLLLFSDGLRYDRNQQRIKQILTDEPDDEKAIKLLASIARKDQDQDNFTIILITIGVGNKPIDQ